MHFKGYVDPPVTTEEHIKTKRREREVTQAQAATTLDMSAAAILHWEKSDTETPIACMPAVIPLD